MDPATNKSKGFGFVKFASEEEAQKSIAEMNGKVKGMFIKYQ
jgi:RNA recognition motif-containing protein